MKHSFEDQSDERSSGSETEDESGDGKQDVRTALLKQNFEPQQPKQEKADSSDSEEEEDHSSGVIHPWASIKKEAFSAVAASTGKKRIKDVKLEPSSNKKLKVANGNEAGKLDEDSKLDNVGFSRKPSEKAEKEKLAKLGIESQPKQAKKQRGSIDIGKLNKYRTEIEQKGNRKSSNNWTHEDEILFANQILHDFESTNIFPPKDKSDYWSGLYESLHGRLEGERTKKQLRDKYNRMKLKYELMERSNGEKSFKNQNEAQPYDILKQIWIKENNARPEQERVFNKQLVKIEKVDEEVDIGKNGGLLKDGEAAGTSDSDSEDDRKLRLSPSQVLLKNTDAELKQNGNIGQQHLSDDKHSLSQPLSSGLFHEALKEMEAKATNMVEKAVGEFVTKFESLAESMINSVSKNGVRTAAGVTGTPDLGMVNSMSYLMDATFARSTQPLRKMPLGLRKGILQQEAEELRMIKRRFQLAQDLVQIREEQIKQEIVSIDEEQ